MCPKCQINDYLKDVSTHYLQLNTVNHLCHIFVEAMDNFFEPHDEKFPHVANLADYSTVVEDVREKVDDLDTPFVFDPDPGSPEVWEIERGLRAVSSIRHSVHTLHELLPLGYGKMYHRHMKSPYENYGDWADLYRIWGAIELAERVLQRLLPEHSIKSSPADLPSPSQN